MFISDSRQHGGPGILALQSHEQRVDLEHRTGLLAVRVVDRRTRAGELGHFVTDEDAGGDVIGAMVWKPSTRALPAWSWVFPSQTQAFGGETVTVAQDRGASRGGTASNGTPRTPEPDGPGGFGGGILTATGSVTVGSGDVGIITPFPGGSFPGGPVKGGAVLKFGSGGTSAKATASTPAPAQAESPNADTKPRTIVKPTRGSGWQRDDRFKNIVPPTPLGWPGFPGDWHGLTVQSTDHDKQIEYFHPTDPRIPLVHGGSLPAVGALVCDTTSGVNRPDLSMHARLHSMLRVLRSPARSPSGRNAVAWNLTTGGQGDTQGGYVIDDGQAGKSGRGNDPRRGPTSGTGGLFRGPNSGLRPNTRAAPRGTNLGAAQGIIAGGARAGAGGAALIVGMMSHNHGGPIHVGLTNDRHRIGSDGDGHPVNPVHLSIESLFINPKNTIEDGPLNLSRVFREGEELDYPVLVHFAFSKGKQKFDWYTWAAEEEPPYTPPPTREPDDPEPPPTRGPTTPGERRGGMSGIAPNRTQGAVSPMSAGRIHTRRWLEMQTASQSFRAQMWGAGSPDLIHSRNPDNPRAPTVLRLDTYAKQVGGAFSYTQPEDTPPYCDGTASGGVWMSPPEVTGEDYASGLVPAGRSISAGVFGIATGVSLGFGVPDLPTGGIRVGYGMSDASGDLALTQYSSTGVGTEYFRFTSEGAQRYKVLGGDPTPPPSGFIDVYAKGTAIYQIESGGTVTQLKN